VLPSRALPIIEKMKAGAIELVWLPGGSGSSNDDCTAEKRAEAAAALPWAQGPGQHPHVQVRSTMPV